GGAGHRRPRLRDGARARRVRRPARAAAGPRRRPRVLPRPRRRRRPPALHRRQAVPEAAPVGLEVARVSLQFEGLSALTNVSLRVEPGTLAALVGPNGAGKTSLLNCVGGFYTPTSGRIAFGPHAIHGLPPHRIAAHGIARTFQFVELFRQMSV